MPIQLPNSKTFPKKWQELAAMISGPGFETTECTARAHAVADTDAVVLYTNSITTCFSILSIRNHKSIWMQLTVHRKIGIFHMISVIQS